MLFSQIYPRGSLTPGMLMLTINILDLFSYIFGLWKKFISNGSNNFLVTFHFYFESNCTFWSYYRNADISSATVIHIHFLFFEFSQNYTGTCWSEIFNHFRSILLANFLKINSQILFIKNLSPLIIYLS